MHVQPERVAGGGLRDLDLGLDLVLDFGDCGLGLVLVLDRLGVDHELEMGLGVGEVGQWVRQLHGFPIGCCESGLEGGVPLSRDCANRLEGSEIAYKLPPDRGVETERSSRGAS